MIGYTLSHFEITGRLGEGGMGTVYRGRDTRLGREVAIKVLPGAFVADAERLARFEREAKLLASLNHPNIAGIYEVGEAVPEGGGADPSTAAARGAASARDDDSAAAQGAASARDDDSAAARGAASARDDDSAAARGAASARDDDSAAARGAASARDDGLEGEPAAAGPAVHFLVMELAEGEDLAERLRRGPLALDEGLGVAIQIAKALEAAHTRGIVHRDLKPANVKLTPDGGVKVLDFGLAKAFDAGAGGAVRGDLTHSPTLTAQMTSAGMILGTAAYMSPEQAKGEEADKRSDIWSFGVVLWEMLTGRKTFDEKTVSETLAAVLKSDPDHSALPPSLPLGVRRLIERCLQKDPDQRLHDIADARLELEAVLRGDDSAALPVAPEVGAPVASRGWKIAAVAATLVALASLALHLVPGEERDPAGSEPIRFTIDRPPGYFDGRGPGLAVSRDGTKVAYVAGTGPNDSQIFLRPLDRVESEPVPGTEQGLAPFFSPDGTRLGFWRDFGIYSVSIHGGAPTLLAEIQNFRGATWAPDGTIWFSPDTEAGLWQMDGDGSNARRVTGPDAARGERSHRWPTVVPGGDAVLFTVGTADIARFDEARIDALRISTGDRKTVLKGGMYPLFLPPDILLYTVSGSLMGVRFDAGSLEIQGSPTPLIEGLKTLPLSGVVAAAVAPDGSLATGLGEPFFGARRLVAYSRDGTSRPLTDEIRPYQALALSPDESTLALDIDAANATIWLLDLERDIQTRLTTRWSHNLPVWSPDGDRLVSSTSSGGTYQIYLHHLATGASEVLHESTEAQFFATSWSVDGDLSVTVIPAGQNVDIWLHPVDDPSAGRALVDTPFAEWGGRFSPDGRWLTFNSNESGRDEIYVVAIDGSGAKLRVSSQGGFYSTWSRTGEEIYFYDGSSLMAAAVEHGERLRVGVPEPLFRTGPVFAFAGSTIDVSRDGEFLLIEYAEHETETAMDLVFTRYWLGELERQLMRE